ncbi:Glycogen synthase [Anaerobiospirillum thomasii]|uniref:glycogen synthase GlgA n=1 Tax=Anaerobiospirillum thomasii TaxID=179995 RepID=UPI000D9362DD|nr:glycogen synthase GlgA [Anaerobiospirillum thomasii]SPT71971.1 Glycogen synthase [Anaerobiospirillum thomasii]
MRVLFISSEVADIIKTGGLADVAKALPAALIKKGHEVKVVMPCYSVIKDYKELPVIGTAAINKDTPLEKRFAIRQKILNGNVEVWLIEYDQYFDRTSLYGDNNQAYFDNGERYAFLSAAALEATKAMDFKPDIVHCNDWHAGLVPMILRIKYAKDEFFEKTRSVITIHNGAFQGVFDRSQINFIPEIMYVYNDMISQGQYINFLKCGVFYADKINTVSPGYAKELTTYLGGHGMTKNFQDRYADLCGIVNGCDYSDWDPETDKHLLIRYNITTMEEKILGKYFLQKRLGLAMGDMPLYGMVARLTDQKGIGILIPILDNFLKHKVQVVIQGTGDPKFAHELEELQKRHKDKFVFISAYDESIAHQIEAGSDFFLMPSIFEPCGLNQIYSLAYGTLPIVRAVGGLKDTVIDYDQHKDIGNGFVFEEPSSEDLLSCMRRTLIFYLEDQEEMQRIKRNAMRVRFEWEDSSTHYEELYKQALQKPKW